MILIFALGTRKKLLWFMIFFFFYFLVLILSAYIRCKIHNFKMLYTSSIRSTLSIFGACIWNRFSYIYKHMLVCTYIRINMCNASIVLVRHSDSMTPRAWEYWFQSLTLPHTRVANIALNAIYRFSCHTVYRTSVYTAIFSRCKRNI